MKLRNNKVHRSMVALEILISDLVWNPMPLKVRKRIWDQTRCVASSNIRDGLRSAIEEELK
jgi:hypothetical protein